jgi:hypothetical protein
MLGEVVFLPELLWKTRERDVRGCGLGRGAREPVRAYNNRHYYYYWEVYKGENIRARAMGYRKEEKKSSWRSVRLMHGVRGGAE